MIETKIPGIDVNQIMEEISEDVALITKLPSFQKTAGADNFPASCPELNALDASPDIQSLSLQNRYTVAQLLAFHDTEFITYATEHYYAEYRTKGGDNII